MLKIMTRVCVDNSSGTTTATKKYVDKRCLSWFAYLQWGQTALARHEALELISLTEGAATRNSRAGVSSEGREALRTAGQEAGATSSRRHARNAR